MKWTKIYIYDVEHGLSSSVLDSSGNTLLIDCGRRTKFSPAKHLASMKNVLLRDLYIDLLILSHPHGDHIEDIQNLKQTKVRNKMNLSLDLYTDDELKKGNTEQGYRNLMLYKTTYAHFKSEYYSPPHWEFYLNTQFGLKPEQARAVEKNSVINNSSIISVVQYAGVKIIFPGDIQVNAWKTILDNAEFVEMAKNPSIIVAPHHGHKSSFCQDIYDKLGKPFVNVCSLDSGDEHLANQYSTEKAARGCKIGDDDRWMLSTRSDGTVVITIYENGQWHLGCEDLGNNEK